MAFSIKRSTYRYPRTETPLRDVPVLRMAYFFGTAHRAVFGKTYMLQARCALRVQGSRISSKREKDIMR